MSALRVAAALCLLALALATGPARAQARAWLDRDRIEAGETATLNVEAAGNAAPDYAPLLADFDLSGHSSRQQFDWVQGRMQVRSLYAVVLRPRGAGALRIPSLRVGAHRTAPLLLQVTAPSAVRAPVAAGREVFIESEADDADPYVQQSVGWTVRLYALPALVSGRLDQEAPPGASLQRIGDDVQYRRDIGGRSYQVIERRYLLVPERSGGLAMPPARFEGRAVGGVFDRWFGDGQVDLRARAAPRVLGVRPIPPGAPTPWLPLHAATLEYIEQPRAARVGEAASFVVQLLADGASRAQLPALDMPAPPGADVFAEAAQIDETVVAGRPRVRVTRRFSVVPTRPGALRVAGPQLTWWDVRAGRARVARLAPVQLDVAPGVVAADAPPRAAQREGIASPPVSTRPLWPLAALGVLALVLLAWGLWRRGRSSAPGAPVDAAPATGASASSASLSRTLALGDLADIDALLRALAPVPGDLDAVAAQLDDAPQREAVLALRAARWGDGDLEAARARLRAAFAAGPRWHRPAPAAAEPLPPLYPGA